MGKKSTKKARSTSKPAVLTTSGTHRTGPNTTGPPAAKRTSKHGAAGSIDRDRTSKSNITPKGGAGTLQYKPAAAGGKFRFPHRYDLFINGRTARPQSGSCFAVQNPATEAVVTEVADANEADINKAVRAGRRAMGAWSVDSLPGLATLSVEINRQARMIGYLNAFALYTLASVLALPFVLMVRREQTGPATRER